MTRSAGAPGRDRPGLGPAERCVAVGGRRAEQRGGAVAAALAAREPLVELDRARLLEQVDHRMRVACRGRARRPRRRSRRAGPMPSARSRSVVGQRQHQQPAASRAAAMSGSVRWVACTAVKRSPSAPASASTRGRRPPVGVRARPRSRPAARRRARAAGGRARRPSRRPSAAEPGSTARTLWIAAPIRAPGPSRERLDALGPGVGVAVARSAAGPRSAARRCRRAGSRRRAA